MGTTKVFRGAPHALFRKTIGLVHIKEQLKVVRIFKICPTGTTEGITWSYTVGAPMGSNFSFFLGF